MKKVKIYIIAALGMTFWGLSFVWSKIVLDHYNPFTLIFLRLVVSSILLLSVLKLFNYHDKIKKEHYKLFLLLAFFEPFLYFIGETFGLNLVSATVSAIIIATIPVFTPFAALWFLKEKMSILNVFGMIFSFFGVIVLVFNPSLEVATSPTGIALLFLAVVSAVAYTMVLKKLSHAYNSVFIITVQNIIGVFYFLPFFLIFDYSHFLAARPDFQALSSLFFLALFGSTLAFIFFTTAVRGIGAAKASIFANLIPVITAVFSAWMLSEHIGLNKILGMTIVISGVLISQTGKILNFNDIYKKAFRNKID